MGDATTSEYTISELEETSGVSRRTIHYYVTRGLLPPPDGAGLAARYGEHHLLRLRLIEVLKRAQLRLDGVRELLDAMSREDLRQLVQFAEEDPDAGAEQLRGWVMRSVARLYGSPSGFASGFAGWTPREPPGLAELTSPVDEALRGSPFRERYETRLRSGEAGLTRWPDEADTWRRMRVLPDLELHYRPRGDSRFMMRLRDVVDFIRRTFGDEVESGVQRGEDDRTRR